MEIKNYSQNTEQEAIMAYFNGKVGRFIDFGANDGITLSNTYALACMGWKGICVEPSPIAYKKLSKLYEDYPFIYTRNFAIANKVGKITLFHSDEHLGKGDISLLSSIKKEEIVRWGDTQKFEEIEVDACTVEYFLQELPFPDMPVDFISIDCEGMDLDILRKLNLSKLQCQMVCIEYNGNEEVLQEIIDICKSFDLKTQILKNAENIIMAI